MSKEDSKTWIAIAENLRAEAKRARENAGLYPKVKDEILKSAQALEDAASSAAFAGDNCLPLHVPVPGVSSDAEIQSLRAELEKLRSKLRDLEVSLKDPNIVHTNMCRGIIARVTPEQYFHSGGSDDVERWQRMLRLERAADAQNRICDNPTVAEIKEAELMYIEYTNSHPDLHSNRFPTWEQIGSGERRKWVEALRMKNRRR